ncbi:enoyl-CoA hydratase [Pseudomonas sp. WN033]|nr:enoyl-CoA hydratase [Pseudomonas sp. WN033]
MASQAILLRREGAVLVLSNNNVAARNALSPEFYEALSGALSDAAADSTVGAVVLTGEGGHFCSGGDLRQLATRRELPIGERREKLEGLHNLIRSVRDFPKPVIAAVEGAAAGAGLSLALACDMLVAARTSVFSAAYVKVGLTPDGGATAFLAEFVSRQVLTELCLTGERLSGERLHALGPVNRLVEHGQALAEAIALAAQIATGPERAMSRIKDLCWQGQRNTLDAQLELEARYMVLSQESEESREGINSFLEKRQADYTALRTAGELKIQNGQQKGEDNGSL